MKSLCKRKRINSAHYAKDPDISEPQKEEIVNYWNSFESQTHIPYTLFFNNNVVYYYETYNCCILILKGVWNFVLKEVRSGKVLLKVTYSVTESHCIFHEESLTVHIYFDIFYTIN